MNAYCNYNLKNQLQNVINDLDVTDYQRKIIEERFLREVLIYETKSKVAEFFYLFLSIFVTIATIILPGLLSIQEVHYSDDEEKDREFKSRVYWSTWVISLLVTISNGLVQFLNLHTQFITFSQTREKLLSIGWTYFELSGPFKKKTHKTGFIKFCECVDKIKKDHMSQEFNFITPQEDESDGKRRNSSKGEELHNLEIEIDNDNVNDNVKVNDNDNVNNISATRFSKSKSNKNKKENNNLNLHITNLKRNDKISKI